MRGRRGEGDWYGLNNIRMDQRMGMELILLMSMRAPWKARFFSFPLVFLKESPRVSFSLSQPNCPQWSASWPNFAFAWKELSRSSSRIGPTSSALILEKNFFGPLSTQAGQYSFVFLTVYVFFQTTSSSTSSSISSSYSLCFFFDFFSSFFASFFSIFTSFFCFFLGQSSKESSYDQKSEDSTLALTFCLLLGLVYFTSSSSTMACLFTFCISFSYSRVLGLSNFAIHPELPAAGLPLAACLGLATFVTKGLSTLFLWVRTFASTLGLTDCLNISCDFFLVLAATFSSSSSGCVLLTKYLSIFQLFLTYSLMTLTSPFLINGLFF